MVSSGEMLGSRRVTAYLLATSAISLGCEAGPSRALQTGPLREHRQLARAAGSMRPFLPRMTLLLSWAPCDQLLADSNGIPGVDCPAPSPLPEDVLAAGDRIERAAEERSDGRTLHALGFWYLLQASSPRLANLAVSQLEQAVGYQPSNGELWSDLAAAYQVRARRMQQPEDLVRSLTASDRALRVDPGLQAARFNRALALEALFLWGDAESAWREYLDSAEADGWRKEAEARLAAVSARSRRMQSRREVSDTSFRGTLRQLEDSVALDPLQAMRHAELRLLGGGSPTARILAEILRRRSGDSMLAEEVRIWEAPVPPSSRLRTGYAEFREALRLYEALDVQAAEFSFEEAVEDLHAAGSPLHLWASYYAAVCRYWDGDLARAGEELRQIRTAAGAGAYPILQGHIAWMLGLIAASESHFDQAFEHYQEALRLFETSGLVQEAGFVGMLLSELLHLLNDSRSAWRYLYGSLSRAEVWRNPRWRQSLFDEAASGARALRQPETALYFQRRALEAALTSEQAPVISEAYARRSFAFWKAGHLGLAEADAEQARRWLARIGDASVRHQIEPTVLIAEARVQRRDKAEAAVERLTAAIRDRQRRGAHSLLAELQLERARLLRALGRGREAEQALVEAIEVIEIGSRSIQAEQRRSAYSSIVRGVFDELIQLQIELRKSPRRALEFAERARAHEFLTHRRGPEGLGASGLPEAWGERLGTGEAILVYRVLEHRLLIWLVDANEATFVERPLASSELADQVDHLVRALSQSAAEVVVRDWASRLHRELIVPVRTRLAGVERLWIVPDRALFGLPFGVLLDPASGRFLSEDHQLAKVLATGLLEERPPATPVLKAPAYPSVLAVGDPAFDVSRFPALVRLRDAREEAVAVARAYRGAELLLGEAASRNRFFEELARRDVLHFAGHAISNAEVPDLSMLLLAADRDRNDAGLVYGREIEALSLGHLRLAVLAACRTSAGSAGSEGFSGFARPFLAAGVSVVIGSVWDVEDQESVRFFADFHQAYAGEKLDPFRALQQAQTKAFSSSHGRSPNRSFTWAAFEAYAARPALKPRED